MLRFGLFGGKLPNFIFLMVILRFFGNHCVHGGFEIIFTFETYRGNHASNQKAKQEINGTTKRWPNPRHANTQPNQTEHKLKYLEACLSSFLKLVFGKIKPNRGHEK